MRSLTIRRSPASLRAPVVLALVMASALSSNWFGAVAHAEDKPVTKTYSFTQQCTGNVGGWCTPTRLFKATTKGLLGLKYTASTKHCTPVDVQYSVETGLSQSKYAMHKAVAPGGSVTSIFNLPAGSYDVRVTVKDSPGGCEGQVQSWGGTMQITTTVESTSTPSPTTKPKSSSSNRSTSGSGTSNGGSAGGSEDTLSDASTSSGATTSGDSDSAEASGSPSAASGPVASASPGTLANGAEKVSDESSFPLWVIIAVIVLAIVLGGGGFAYWRRRTQT